MEDYYYIVRIKEAYRNELKLTTIGKEFCGKLIRQASHENLVFELLHSNALVVIPVKWIEFCAPSKMLWNAWLEKL